MVQDDHIQTATTLTIFSQERRPAEWKTGVLASWRDTRSERADDQEGKGLQGMHLWILRVLHALRVFLGIFARRLISPPALPLKGRRARDTAKCLARGSPFPRREGAGG